MTNSLKVVPTPHPLSKLIWTWYYAGMYMEIAQLNLRALLHVCPELTPDTPSDELVETMYKAISDRDEYEIVTFGGCHRVT